MQRMVHRGSHSYPQPSVPSAVEPLFHPDASCRSLNLLFESSVILSQTAREPGERIHGLPVFSESPTHAAKLTPARLAPSVRLPNSRPPKAIVQETGGDMTLRMSVAGWRDLLHGADARHCRMTFLAHPRIKVSAKCISSKASLLASSASRLAALILPATPLDSGINLSNQCP